MPTRRRCSRPAPQRLLRHAALAGDLDAAGERLLGRLVGRACRCPWSGCSHTLAPGALADRRRLAAVVDVRVRADDQAHVLEPQPGLVERALEVGHRAGLVHPGVDEHDRRRPTPSAHALQCGTPGHGSGSRSRQTPGQHALAAAHLAPACRLAHPAGR